MSSSLQNNNISALNQHQPSKKNQEQKEALINIEWAKNENDIKEAQKLRYKIFAEEMGANISGGKEKLDRDFFDEHCEHLIARNSKTNKVIGTYRVLTPEAVKIIGSLYSEMEFELGLINDIKDQVVEVGRACIHKKYRSGNVIMQLWAELGRFMKKNNYRYMVGCSSISIKDGGILAASVYKKLYDAERIVNHFNVKPKLPLSIEQLAFNKDCNTPALLKGYLRVGAVVCGKPAWDPDFNTADFFTMLDLTKIPRRYFNHFLSN